MPDIQTIHPDNVTSSTPSDFHPAYNLLRLPEIAAGLVGKVQNLDSGLDSGLDTGLNNRVDIWTRFSIAWGQVTPYYSAA